MKKLIPALCLLLVAAALMGTSTFAWFSMNKTVTATGMKVKATSAASLIISKSAPTNTTTTVTVDMSSEATELSASTWDSAKAPTTGLKYVTNSSDVVVDTGLQGSQTLSYAEATNSGATHYYVDYEVYIAASGNAAIKEKLVVSVDSSASTTAEIHNAVSVAFFVGDTTVANYKGSIALKDKETGKVVLEESNDIPVATADGSAYIKVIMRVYLDGALTDGSGKAIVRNANANVAEVTINASFTTESKST